MSTSPLGHRRVHDLPKGTVRCSKCMRLIAGNSFDVHLRWCDSERDEPLPERVPKNPHGYPRRFRTDAEKAHLSEMGKARYRLKKQKKEAELKAELELQAGLSPEEEEEVVVVVYPELPTEGHDDQP